jgi:peroxiredoxin (alkyl hydroperoxide reductase subunit C)
MHELINHFPLGRNVNEALRMLDALRHLETYGEVCPANWEEGKDAMTADLKSTSAYLASH